MRTHLALVVVVAAGAPAFAQGSGHDQCGVCLHALPPIDLVDPLPMSDIWGQNAPLAPLSETFNLSSRPSAAHTIYLDFDGHVTTGTQWNRSYTNNQPIVTPAFDPANNGASFTTSELQRIQYIWQRVVEDFSPFDVNVTTREPAAGELVRSGSGDTQWGIRVVIGNNNWYNAAGGVAYVGSFTSSTDTPTFVFENHLGNGNEKYVAEAISHEVGHTLGLSHDGRSSPSEAYYSGHGSGDTGWAPIMGNGYSRNLTQWSKGEYSNANQLQDDLAIITSRNGFGYVPDDHGATIGTATPLAITPDTAGLRAAVEGSGVISTRSDLDLFSFEHGGGLIDLLISPFDRGPNLDILASLFDGSGQHILTSNPANRLDAAFAMLLDAGIYFLRIDGTGLGDPLSGGYTDYGSLGQYFISGTIGLVPEPASAALCLMLLGALAAQRRRA